MGVLFYLASNRAEFIFNVESSLRADGQNGVA